MDKESCGYKIRILNKILNNVMTLLCNVLEKASQQGNFFDIVSHCKLPRVICFEYEKDIA